MPTNLLPRPLSSLLTTVLRGLLTAMVTIALCGARADAGPCLVGEPAYPTVGSALTDTTCSQVTIPSGGFAEALLITRDVALQGAGSQQTTILAAVEVRGGATATLEGLSIDLSGPGSGGCDQGLLATDGASVHTSDVEVRNKSAGSCSVVLFADDFETGDPSLWDSFDGRSPARGKRPQSANTSREE